MAIEVEEACGVKAQMVSGVRASESDMENELVFKKKITKEQVCWYVRGKVGKLKIVKYVHIFKVPKI